MWKDSETEIDFLDFDYLIDTVSNIIKNDALLPSTVGVYGDWGSGKSSLINLSIAALKEEKGTESIYFNGWLFEDYEDAKTALLGNILDTIEQNRTLDETAKKCIAGLYKSIDKMKLVKKAIRSGAGFFLTGGSNVLADVALSAVIEKTVTSSDAVIKDDWVDTIKAELSNKELREDINSFRENFDKLLKQTRIERLVVFIDELDRCSPDTILNTLEAIRLFLYVGNTVFIIGADERHISYAVQTKFNEIEGYGIDIGKEYLEKIVQYPVRIPRLSASEVELYIALLFMQRDLNFGDFEKVIGLVHDKKKENFFNFKLDYGVVKEYDSEIADKVKLSLEIAKQLSSVLAGGLNGNPRHCKRFLNSMEMRMSMARYKGIDLDKRILSKIMMLEYFKPRMFSELVDAEIDIDGSIIELMHFEKGELDKLGKLKNWEEDSWVKNWIEKEPYIGSEDLRPYFYFGRTSLDKQYETGTTKLSREAQDVLKNLIAGTQSGLNSAMQNAGSVNDYEVALIIEHLFGRIKESTEIVDMQLRALLEWGSKKEGIHVSIIKGLQSIDGTRIKPPHIPRVRNFGKEIGKLSEIDSILDNWIKENPKLTSFIATEREG
ncbi:KAP family NTPase [Salipaludibacillus sp. LMS25]|jgi:predicted KAP-like P-loop ATPase|uniref:KAP family P-loop NTPase fold protein n=1 Tax=Salipaludibacillus sp. LMS25 TaxID=2924031 RepID=UPI0020D14D4E|nr:P-loop NTPase fold protein [Salipaludibacillus sp. LMS25]UTR14915.1 KAP family NTPase [Salipaludibacillus sp. LMS25]